MLEGVSWDIGPDRNNPHILEQQAKYNHDFYQKHFPNHTVYLASIRHPVDWFISFIEHRIQYRYVLI